MVAQNVRIFPSILGLGRTDMMHIKNPISQIERWGFAFPNYFIKSF